MPGSMPSSLTNPVVILFELKPDHPSEVPDPKTHFNRIDTCDQELTTFKRTCAEQVHSRVCSILDRDNLLCFKASSPEKDLYMIRTLHKAGCRSSL